MKALSAYYSITNITKKLAEEITHTLNADLKIPVGASKATTPPHFIY